MATEPILAINNCQESETNAYYIKLKKKINMSNIFIQFFLKLLSARKKKELVVWYKEFADTFQTAKYHISICRSKDSY